MNTEEKIVLQATEQLTVASGLSVEWNATPNSPFDGYLVIHASEQPIRLATLIKRRGLIHYQDELNQLSKTQETPLLVAETISDDLKRIFQQASHNYLDMAGNCYIQSSGQLILIQGRKAPTKGPVLKQPFGKSGLRVLFTLLTQPDAINWSIRDLAEQSGVSIGTAQQTTDYLKKSGYTVTVDNQRRKLIQSEKLREQWVSRYATALKPSLTLGRFRLPKDISPDNWQKLKLQSGTYWSGEAAADALTNNLRPEKLTLYTKEDQSGLRQKYRLLPDLNGPVQVNKLFWKATEPTTAVPTVPPLLIYADLLATTDPRTLEIARNLYQNYVQHPI